MTHDFITSRASPSSPWAQSASPTWTQRASPDRVSGRTCELGGGFPLLCCIFPLLCCIFPLLCCIFPPPLPAALLPRPGRSVPLPQGVTERGAHAGPSEAPLGGPGPCASPGRAERGGHSPDKAGRAGPARAALPRTGSGPQLPPLIVPRSPDNSHGRWHPTPTSVRLY